MPDSTRNENQPASVTKSTLALPDLVRECAADMRWALSAREAGRLAEYRGRHIAVLNATVVGDDEDPSRLRADVSNRLQIAPERLAVVYVDDPQEPEFFWR